MSELVVQEQQYQSLVETLMSPGMQKQLQMACARTITPERLTRIAMTEARRVKNLSSCNPASFYGAVMQCAQLGLEPGLLGLAYIIPYKHKGKYEAQFQIGYKGLLNLMWRSEMVSSVQAEVVYEGDHFDYSNGIPPTLNHVPAEPRPDGAKPTHAYCVIGTTTGGWIFRVMTYSDIEKLRRTHSTASRDDAPWVTAWDEMACKTLIKRTAKRAPISTEAQRAIALDDLRDIGLAQHLGTTIEVEKVEAEEPDGEATAPAADEFDPETGERIPDSI